MVHCAKLLRLTNLPNLRVGDVRAIKESMNRRYDGGIKKLQLAQLSSIARLRNSFSATGVCRWTESQLALFSRSHQRDRPPLRAFRCLQLESGQPCPFSSQSYSSRFAISGTWMVVKVDTVSTQGSPPRCPASRQQLLTVVVHSHLLLCYKGFTMLANPKR